MHAEHACVVCVRVCACSVYVGAGDALVFNSVVVKNTDGVDLGAGLIVAWVVCFALAVLVSGICFYLKMRVILALRRKRRDTFSVIQTYHAYALGA